MQIDKEDYCGEDIDQMMEEVAQQKENETAEQDATYIKMDYTLESPEERVKKVEEIIAATPPERLTASYLSKLGDYIASAMTKEEKQNKRILTDNRMVTINKRETSFEGLVGRLENGEDGIYNMIANDKNIIFQPKVSITEEDLAEIPELKSLHDAIAVLEEKAKGARGKKAYALKQQIISMRQDQYVIKSAYKKPIYCSNLVKSIARLNLDERVYITPTGHVRSTGLINFYNELHVSALLCNFNKIKDSTWDKLNNDSRWMMVDFEKLVKNTLKEKYPLYYDLTRYKIDGKTNLEIQDLLERDYGIRHSVEYLSSLWRKKIPKLIVEQAENEWLEWHYTFEERGKWKKCSRCGQIKLAHNNFFSKNKTSKDGYYSICKECRNKKS